MRKERPRRARYLLPIAGLLGLIGTLGGIKACQIGSLMAMGKQAKAQGPPPEAVGTARAESQSWEETLPAVGSVASQRGVGLSTETAGVVTKIAFDSGATVEKGQLLVELDASVERAQLASAQARSAAGGNASMARPSVASPPR